MDNGGVLVSLANASRIHTCVSSSSAAEGPVGEETDCGVDASDESVVVSGIIIILISF
jgi:hypothetical protein